MNVRGPVNPRLPPTPRAGVPLLPHQGVGVRRRDVRPGGRLLGAVRTRGPCWDRLEDLRPVVRHARRRLVSRGWCRGPRSGLRSPQSRPGPLATWGFEGAGFRALSSRRSRSDLTRSSIRLAQDRHRRRAREPRGGHSWPLGSASAVVDRYSMRRRLSLSARMLPRRRRRSQIGGSRAALGRRSRAHATRAGSDPLRPLDGQTAVQVVAGPLRPAELTAGRAPELARSRADPDHERRRTVRAARTVKPPGWVRPATVVLSSIGGAGRLSHESAVNESPARPGSGRARRECRSTRVGHHRQARPAGSSRAAP